MTYCPGTPYIVCNCTVQQSDIGLGKVTLKNWRFWEKKNTENSYPFKRLMMAKQTANFCWNFEFRRFLCLEFKTAVTFHIFKKTQIFLNWRKDPLTLYKLNYRWPFMQSWQCLIHNTVPIKPLSDQGWIPYQCLWF